MGRPKGINTKLVNFSLHHEIIDRLEKYSKASMIPKTRIVERALYEYLDKMEGNNK